MPAYSEQGVGRPVKRLLRLEWGMRERGREAGFCRAKRRKVSLKSHSLTKRSGQSDGAL